MRKLNWILRSLLGGAAAATLVACEEIDPPKPVDKTVQVATAPKVETPIVVEPKTDPLEAVRDHYELAHPGMPRLRYTEAPGVSRIVCADCGETFDAAKQYSKSKGQDKDPIDRVGAHLALHQEED